MMLWHYFLVKKETHCVYYSFALISQMQNTADPPHQYKLFFDAYSDDL
jgi:hypothetical protein